jgi:serine/threonine protein kinase
MLTQESPWPNDDYERAICECEYDLETGIWEGISAEAKDLISLLLERNPAERSDAQDALNHPWFQTMFPDHRKARLVRETQERLGMADELAERATLALASGEDFS